MFHGEADESVDWEAGDVIVRVRSQRREGGWARHESGILGRVTLSVGEVRPGDFCCTHIRLTNEQALLGFERTMTHLDGRTITVKRDGTTQPGEVEVMEGEGVSSQNTPSKLGPSIAYAGSRCPPITTCQLETCTSSTALYCRPRFRNRHGRVSPLSLPSRLGLTASQSLRKCLATRLLIVMQPETSSNSDPVCIHTCFIEKVRVKSPPPSEVVPGLRTPEKFKLVSRPRSADPCFQRH